MNPCQVSVSDLLTPIIGLLAVLIAYQQWRTNQRNEAINSKRLKHELYEKRYDVYLSARTLLREIMIQGKVTDKMLIDYWAGTNASRFLLKKEMTDYLEELEHKAVDLQTKMEEDAEGTPGYAGGAKERGEMKKWFHAQIAVLNEKFNPYLNLEE